MLNITTPWGQADHHQAIAPGIDFYSTPSHGGFKLSPERLARISVMNLVRCRTGLPLQGWFEEDCDWCIVVIYFPEYFTAEEREMAAKIAAHYHDQ